MTGVFQLLSFLSHHPWLSENACRRKCPRRAKSSHLQCRVPLLSKTPLHPLLKPIPSKTTHCPDRAQIPVSPTKPAKSAVPESRKRQSHVTQRRAKQRTLPIKRYPADRCQRCLRCDAVIAAHWHLPGNQPPCRARRARLQPSAPPHGSQHRAASAHSWSLLQPCTASDVLLYTDSYGQVWVLSERTAGEGGPAAANLMHSCNGVLTHRCSSATASSG